MEFIIPMQVIVPLLHMWLSINYTESVTVQSGKQKLCSRHKGDLILRIGYRSIERAGDVNGMRRLWSVSSTCPSRSILHLSLNSESWAVHTAPLDSWPDFRSVLDSGKCWPEVEGKRKMRSEYLLTCILPCWGATGWHCHC